MAFRGIDKDPIRNFKFKVVYPTQGGFGSAGFSRVSGLKETTEVVEYREGTDAVRMRKLPGQTSFDNVTMERGLTTDRELLNWRRLVVNIPGGGGRQLGSASPGAVAGPGGESLGDLLRRNVTVALGDYFAEAGTQGAWVWTMIDAWPVSLEASEFAGDGNDVALETVEFTHEGLDISAPV